METFFPTVRQLRRGILLGTIAGAIYACSCPDYYDREWKGKTLELSDQQSVVGFITISPSAIVAAFCDVHSERAKGELTDAFDWQHWFQGMPDELLQLARGEAIARILAAYPGTITSAFWSDGEYLTAVEPWGDVYEHGAHILRIELMDWAVGIRKWMGSMGLAWDHRLLMRSLFERRLASSDEVIAVEPWEYGLLTLGGDAGIEKSRGLLDAVGIRLS